MHRLVVLGDEGVGKTHLVRQVNFLHLGLLDEAANRILVDVLLLP